MRIDVGPGHSVGPFQREQIRLSGQRRPAARAAQQSLALLAQVSQQHPTDMQTPSKSLQTAFRETQRERERTDGPESVQDVLRVQQGLQLSHGQGQVSAESEGEAHGVALGLLSQTVEECGGLGPSVLIAVTMQCNTLHYTLQYTIQRCC